MLNKSLLTNLVTILLFGVCFFFSPFPGSEILLSASLFAFSGAFTNWLAIHMLFEKIPFIYGTGVITIHFEEFKMGIKKLIMENFFNQETISKFSKIPTSIMATDAILTKVNLDPIFDELVQIVMRSNLGQMIQMMGQTDVIEQFRKPFLQKCEDYIPKLLEQINPATLFTQEKKLVDNIDWLITAKLDELTPKMIKEIVEDIIRKHLGWLVVWGGVFGGILGAFATLIV